jgi:hypothetical protein
MMSSASTSRRRQVGREARPAAADVPAASRSSCPAWRQRCGDIREGATFFSALMATPPTLLVIEALLPAAARVKTNKATRDRLAGLRAIALAVAHCRGVHRIVEAEVADVRAHFIGARILRRATAKIEVMRTCRRLGWDVEDDNAGDACAVWSFGCGLVDPRSALRVSPLFQRGVAL